MNLNNQIDTKDTIVSQLRDSVNDRINRFTDAASEEQKTGLYYVTTRLNDPIGKSSVEKRLKYVIDTVPLVYNHILNKTVSQHQFESRQYLHPFMLSFVDYSGSRDHLYEFSKLPHIHSILVVHPEVNTRFHELRDNGFRLKEGSRNTLRIQEVDVRDIKPTDEDLAEVIDYSAKSYFLNFIPSVSEETKADMMVLNG